MPRDYEAEYNNRARVPQHPQIMGGWGRDAATYRAEKPPVEVAYGSGGRERFDLFEAGDGPVVLFIHGGYWQALDKSVFSHMARGLNGRGISVAVTSYDLCPNVPLDRIVGQMRQASRTLYERSGKSIVVAGHSAGGHLAACLLATDWAMIDPGLPKQVARSAYAISGLFDLEPLVGTSVNGALKLIPREARRLSPLHWKAKPGTTLDAIVGGAESYEYHRQSETIAQTWAAQGVSTRYETVPDANHFTVIAPLADPNSAMVGRIAEMVEKED
ncbi:MAG TPA: alpha/beta hydrolase [Caulobacteraceae bacterium]|jgi:arylformamidase|nr:alpha/beta hydrolase [Caulobacteraceae bacterium]